MKILFADVLTSIDVVMISAQSNPGEFDQRRWTITYVKADGTRPIGCFPHTFYTREAFDIARAKLLGVDLGGIVEQLDPVVEHGPLIETRVERKSYLPRAGD